MAITSGLTTKCPIQELAFQIAPRRGKEGSEIQVPLDGPRFEGNAGLAISLIQQAAVAHHLLSLRVGKTLEGNVNLHASSVWHTSPTRLSGHSARSPRILVAD